MLEEKIAIDVCLAYCSKHNCGDCYFTNIECKLLTAVSLLKEQQKEILKNNLL